MDDAEQFKQHVGDVVRAVKMGELSGGAPGTQCTCRSNWEKQYVVQVIKDKGLHYQKSMGMDGQHLVGVFRNRKEADECRAAE